MRISDWSSRVLFRSRDRKRALGDAAGKERDRGDEIASQKPDIAVHVGHASKGRERQARAAAGRRHIARALAHQDRAAERRVGTECSSTSRARGEPDHTNKKKTQNSTHRSNDKK